MAGWLPERSHPSEAPLTGHVFSSCVSEKSFTSYSQTYLPMQKFNLLGYFSFNTLKIRPCHLLLCISRRKSAVFLTVFYKLFMWMLLNFLSIARFKSLISEVPWCKFLHILWLIAMESLVSMGLFSFHQNLITHSLISLNALSILCA